MASLPPAPYVPPGAVFTGAPTTAATPQPAAPAGYNSAAMAALSGAPAPSVAGPGGTQVTGTPVTSLPATPTAPRPRDARSSAMRVLGSTLGAPLAAGLSTGLAYSAGAKVASIVVSSARGGFSPVTILSQAGLSGLFGIAEEFMSEDTLKSKRYALGKGIAYQGLLSLTMCLEGLATFGLPLIISTLSGIAISYATKRLMTKVDFENKVDQFLDRVIPSDNPVAQFAHIFLKSFTISLVTSATTMASRGLIDPVVNQTLSHPPELVRDLDHSGPGNILTENQFADAAGHVGLTPEQAYHALHPTGGAITQDEAKFLAEYSKLGINLTEEQLAALAPAITPQTDDIITRLSTQHVPPEHIAGIVSHINSPYEALYVNDALANGVDNRIVASVLSSDTNLTEEDFKIWDDNAKAVAAYTYVIGQNGEYQVEIYTKSLHDGTWYVFTSDVLQALNELGTAHIKVDPAVLGTAENIAAVNSLNINEDKLAFYVKLDLGDQQLDAAHLATWNHIHSGMVEHKLTSDFLNSATYQNAVHVDVINKALEATPNVGIVGATESMQELGKVGVKILDVAVVSRMAEVGLDAKSLQQAAGNDKILSVDDINKFEKDLVGLAATHTPAVPANTETPAAPTDTAVPAPTDTPNPVAKTLTDFIAEFKDPSEGQNVLNQLTTNGIDIAAINKAFGEDITPEEAKMLKDFAEHHVTKALWDEALKDGSISENEAKAANAVGFYAHETQDTRIVEAYENMLQGGDIGDRDKMLYTLAHYGAKIDPVLLADPKYAPLVFNIDKAGLNDDLAAHIKDQKTEINSTHINTWSLAASYKTEFGLKFEPASIELLAQFDDKHDNPGALKILAGRDHSIIRPEVEEYLKYKDPVVLAALDDAGKHGVVFLDNTRTSVGEALAEFDKAVHAGVTVDDISARANSNNHVISTNDLAALIDAKIHPPAPAPVVAPDQGKTVVPPVFDPKDINHDGKVDSAEQAKPAQSNTEAKPPSNEPYIHDHVKPYIEPAGNFMRNTFGFDPVNVDAATKAGFALNMIDALQMSTIDHVGLSALSDRSHTLTGEQIIAITQDVTDNLAKDYHLSTDSDAYKALRIEVGQVLSAHAEIHLPSGNIVDGIWKEYANNFFHGNVGQGSGEQSAALNLVDHAKENITALLNKK